VLLQVLQDDGFLDPSQIWLVWWNMTISLCIPPVSFSDPIGSSF
jgi:hypothetical protein